MVRRSERQRGLFWVNLTVMLAFLFGLWIVGLIRYASDIPGKVIDATTSTDAIVVLTGGSGRLNAGLDLLSKDLAGLMFVSGVYRGIDVRKLLQVTRRDPLGLEKRISIGNAVNTRENAEETAKWVRQKAIKSLRLVTAAYHMPRSHLEFANVMPGVEIVPHPVFPEHVKQNEWWAWPGTAALMASEYNKYLMGWVRLRTNYMFSRTSKPKKK